MVRAAGVAHLWVRDDPVCPDTGASVEADQVHRMVKFVNSLNVRSTAFRRRQWGRLKPGLQT